ncbi:MAG: hypothetical protein JWN82_347 [Candidatus Saccharibacteria bacterium]|nr:hypothetical protein [Candidatus Saccharibacteria bacterium]
MPSGTVKLLVAAVLLLLLTACRDDKPEPPPAAGVCQYQVSEREKLGGPLETPTGSISFGMVRPRADKLQDAYVIDLVNTSDSPVLLDRVQLVTDHDAAPLQFDGAFVAPAGAVQRITAAGKSKQLTPVKGYCLSSTKNRREAHVLVVRVGPALKADVRGFDVSRNNNVSLHYRTADGQRYNAVYPVQIEYPN